MTDCKCPDRCWCPEGQRRYDAERWQKRDKTAWKAKKTAYRKATIAWYREQKDGPCTDCGGEFHPAAMVFDHLPGTEKIENPATLASQGKRRKLEEELLKCELVCANCHAVRTENRKQCVA